MGKSTDVDVPKIVTYFELNKLVPDHVCAYWVQEFIMHRYNIIVGHYGRLSKILRYVHFLVADEVQERYLPFIVSKPLSEIAELLGVDTDELTDVSVIKDLAEERLIEADPLKEDELYTLLQLLKKTCWIEDGVLYCMELYDLPHNIPEFAITATPPPGWPPEGWGRKIEIRPTVKAKAFIESTRFYYKDKYEGATLLLHLVTNWLRRKFNIDEIAVFATSSLRQILQYSLPPGVELFPTGG